MENNKGFYWIGAVIIVFILFLGAAAYYKNKSATNEPVPTIALDANDHVKGNGPVTVIEYGDFQCPACGQYYPVVAELLKQMSTSTTFIFRNFPLPQHANAMVSARAAGAAGKQGKFFEMYDLLYMHQNEWSESADYEKIFTEYAKQLNLNLDQYANDYKSDEVKGKIQNDYKSGVNLGVEGTPTFFVNGKKIELPRNLDEFKAVISLTLDEMNRANPISPNTGIN